MASGEYQQEQKMNGSYAGNKMRRWKINISSDL